VLGPNEKGELRLDLGSDVFVMTIPMEKDVLWQVAEVLEEAARRCRVTAEDLCREEHENALNGVEG